ncbi:PAS domain S-box protein [Paenibacillus filicis]|uniref:histidine kinase n=1 Tax=Paenibacillus gyeongsangnamensis TaxID=3388067 RepID=A0ABT4QCM0_9BACL|nr:PAS domain S-box protein [Paenibacillus filicis]MCZ8514522.1 PAS domain S-box protein [Paenibacillus filicis]
MPDKQINLLIVDDRPDNLLTLTMTLESTDYRIVTAASGEEALRRMVTEDYALILLDAQLPGRGGFGTAELFQLRECSRRIPIIFITANGEAAEQLMSGCEEREVDYIIWPFQPEALRRKVRQFVRMDLDRRRMKEREDLLLKRAAELEEANLRLEETVRKQSHSESVGRVIGETSADVFLLIRSSGHIVSVNPAVRAMFGYEPDALTGTLASRLLPSTEDWFPLSPSRFGRRHKGGVVVEETAVRQDHTIFPAELQVGRVQAEEQGLYLISIRDITEHKLQYMRLERSLDRQMKDLRRAGELLEREMRERTRIAEELRLSYGQIGDILECVTDAFFVLDNDWRIRFLNRTAEFRLGVTQEQALGRLLWDLTIFGTREYEFLIRTMELKAPMQDEFYSERGDGWVNVSAFPSESGLCLYVQDTTERHWMKQSAINSQERFYKIFKASPSLMAIHSLVHRACLDINESWQQHTGYTYEEMVMGGVDLLMVHDAAGEYSRPVQLGTGEALQNVKVRYVTKSGENRTGLLSAEIIDTPEDACVLTVITDITERVETERELARLDRLHVIGEMAAGIAHEIRNPMTTVRGFLQLMGSRQAVPPKDMLDVMVEELNRANSIISEFLALARSKSTDRKRQPLNRVIAAIAPLIQAEATLAGKSVLLELRPCPELELDEKEIRQLILNLALNGLEAMEAGGQLSISTCCEGDCVMLEVGDQGSGMNPEVLGKLGTPFFTTKEQGTGLGLAVCFSIAARHQAKLTCRTGREGTVFTLRLPMNGAPSPDIHA